MHQKKDNYPQIVTMSKFFNNTHGSIFYQLLLKLVLITLLIIPLQAYSANKLQQIYNQLVNAENLASINKDSALTISIKLLEELKEGTNYPDSLLGYAYYILGECYRYGANCDQALSYQDTALKYVSKPDYLFGQSRIYHGKGNIFLILGSFDSAMYYYQKAIGIRTKLNQPFELSKSMVNLGIVYFKKSQYDSALYYYSESLRMRTQINDSAGIVTSLTNIGNVYLYQNNFEIAASYYLKAKQLIDTTVSSRQLASILNNMGNIYNRQGQYTLALENFMQAMRWYDALGDRAGKAKIYNNAALIHFEQSNLLLAMQYHTEALELFTEINDKFGIADTYYYIARIHHINKELDKAKKYFQFALKQKTELGDASGIADCMQNLGVIYLDTHEYGSAGFCLQKAVASYVQIKNKYGQAVALNNLAELNIQLKKYSEAYNYAQKALKVAEMYNGLNEMMVAKKQMAIASEYNGNYKEALRLTKQVIELNDSLFSQKKSETIMELESKYQLERKQQAIEMQQVQLAKRDLEFKNKENEIVWQKRLRNLYLGLVLLLSVLVVMLIRNLVHRKALNNKLAKQQHDILIKNEDLAQLNEELRTTQQQIVMQNETLLQQNNKIVQANKTFQDSVNYAQYIQRAVLPSKQRMNSILPNHFVLYMPKFIVGGDFYWVHQANHKIIVAVGDCTGHGVPGGFLSMLGLAFLKEIATVQNIYKTNLVLDALRSQVIDSLQQTSDLMENNDGIDISLLVIDEQNKTFEYSGARGKIVIISNQSPVIVKGDRMPVGFSPKMKPFNSETFTLLPNQTFYLFTDGFTDQYNGANEKFGMNRFVDLCKNNYSKALPLQKEVFFQTFQNWRGNFEQIDDATVLAINI